MHAVAITIAPIANPTPQDRVLVVYALIMAALEKTESIGQILTGYIILSNLVNYPFWVFYDVGKR